MGERALFQLTVCRFNVRKNRVRAAHLPPKRWQRKKRERARCWGGRAGTVGGPQAGRIRLAPHQNVRARWGAPSTVSYRSIDWLSMRPQLAQINWLIDFWLSNWLTTCQISNRSIQCRDASSYSRNFFYGTHATSGKKMSKGDFILFSGANFYEVNYLISELLRKMKYGR